MNNDFIDEVMGFDPSTVVTAFEKDENGGKKTNPNVYKTNPANSVSEDGHYHSKVRVLLNPYDIKRSIVHHVHYSMRDERGFFMAPSSLAVGNKECPIFKGWKTLWYAKTQDPNDPSKLVEDTTKKDFAKTHFDKSESNWVLVQIIEDENQPELTGQFKVMKLPKVVEERLTNKMNPSDPKKQKQPLMDYLFGPVLDMDVAPGPDDPNQPERKQREISYSLCDFDTDPTPIIKVDGTPLFTDEEIEMIEDYNSANNDLNKAKTEAKKNEAAKKKAELAPQIKPLYAKAIEYIKTYAIDPVVECGYTPWSPELTARVQAWLDAVLALQDPTVPSADTTVANSNARSEKAPTEKLIDAGAPAPSNGTFAVETDPNSDLPF
jgi:hypothetical protein